MIFIPIVIFLLTLFLVITKPKGLGIGYSACVGALIVYLFKFVSNADILRTIDVIWNAVLAFVALVVISYVLNEIGIFKWAAQKMIALSKNKSSKLYTYLILLGAIVSAFFANDGAALILTPIVLAKIQLLNIPKDKMEPFVMGCGFIADSASILLVTSNLVNIIAADYFAVTYMQYALIMIIPYGVAVLSSVVMLHLFYRKQIRSLQGIVEVHKPQDESPIKNKNLALIASVLILVMFVACFIGGYYRVPVSLILLPTSFILAFMTKMKGMISYRKLWRATPFSIIFFAFGMFLLVLGLEEIGLTKLIMTILSAFTSLGQFLSTICTGVFAGLFSCFANNLPAVMSNSLAISKLELSRSSELLQVMANVIGCDIGPKLFPIGSLATLLWLHLLEKQGIKISYRRFMKVGFVLTWPTLILTLVALYFTFALFI